MSKVILESYFLARKNCVSIPTMTDLLQKIPTLNYY